MTDATVMAIGLSMLGGGFTVGCAILRMPKRNGNGKYVPVRQCNDRHESLTERHQEAKEAREEAKGEREQITMTLNELGKTMVRLETLLERRKEPRGS